MGPLKRGGNRFPAYLGQMKSKHCQAGRLFVSPPSVHSSVNSTSSGAGTVPLIGQVPSSTRTGSTTKHLWRVMESQQTSRLATPTQMQQPDSIDTSRSSFDHSRRSQEVAA